MTDLRAADVSIIAAETDLIEPIVICTLGNFSTKLLRGDPAGITRVHGQPEVLVLGARAVRLYPIFHPAAALYTSRMLDTLREDFARLPALLALGVPEQPDPALQQDPPEVPDAPDLAKPRGEEAEGAPESHRAGDPPERGADPAQKGADRPREGAKDRAIAPSGGPGVSEVDQLGLF